MRRPLVIMMARWPGVGQGKTRLAASTSPVRAAQIQRQCLTVLINRLQHHPAWDFALALTPTSRWRQARRQPVLSRPSLITQGSGDLGTRLTGLFRHHGRPGRPVIIIGSDTPHVAIADILAATRHLQRHDVVLGPATDGGYWLIGWGYRPQTQRGGQMPALENIRWSTKHALADTRACLEKATKNQLKTHLLRNRTDIDTAQALHAHGAIKRIVPR